MATTSTTTSTLYNPSQTSASPPAASSSTSPGVIFNLTLAGDSDDEAIYAVQMAFGKGASAGSAAVQAQLSQDWLIQQRDQQVDPQAKWIGGVPQIVNMQVDLGSSDMVCYKLSFVQASATTAD